MFFIRTQQYLIIFDLLATSFGQ